MSEINIKKLIDEYELLESLIIEEKDLFILNQLYKRYYEIKYIFRQIETDKSHRLKKKKFLDRIKWSILIILFIGGSIYLSILFGSHFFLPISYSPIERILATIYVNLMIIVMGLTVLSIFLNSGRINPNIFNLNT